MTPDSFLEAAASRYGFRSVESLIQEVLPEAPEPIVQSIRDAIDRAAESFHERYGSKYGSRYESFLARKENVNTVIRSTFPSKAPLSAENLNGEGYKEAAEAPIEVREEFVDLLREEMREDRRLAEILEKKRHRITADWRWEKLWDEIQTIREAATDDELFGHPPLRSRTAPTADTEGVLATYRSSLREEVGTVRLFGFKQSYPLRKVFFDLEINEQVHQSRRGPEEWKPRIASKLQGVPGRQPGKMASGQDMPKGPGEPPETETFAPEDLMEPGRRIQVVGSPGSGKSTLLQYLTLGSLDEPDRLPVFLKLGSLPKDTEIDPSDSEGFRDLLFEEGMLTWLRRSPDQKGWGPEAKEHLRSSFYDHLEEGTLDVYLDGLDEVSGRPFFRALQKRIKAFAWELKGTGNSLVITMRSYAQAAAIPALSSMEVQPLTDEQVTAFVDAYYPEDDRMSELVDSIREGAVGDVARVPLLLSLITYLFRRKREIITNPLHLFQRAVDHLVTQLDREKNVDRFRTDDPDGHAKQSAFEELAYERIFAPADEAGRRFVFEKDRLQDLAGKHAPESAEAGPFFKDLLATPLLHPVGYEEYAFVHLTLQEYLAARHVAQLDDPIRRIASSVFDPLQVDLEVLPMAMAMLSDPIEAYKQLEELPESLEYNRLRLMLRSQFYLDNPSEETLEHLAASLRELWADGVEDQDPLYFRAVLAGLHETTGPLHERFEDDLIGTMWNGPLRARVWAVKALRLLGTQEAIRSLIDRLADPEEHSKVRLWAVRMLGQIEAEEALQVLKDRLTDPEEHSKVRFRAAWALGEIGNEEAVQSLKGPLRDTKEHSKVRASAASALGKIGTGEALEVLKDVTVDPEEHYIVRQTAASALSGILAQEAVEVLKHQLKDPEGKFLLVPSWRGMLTCVLGAIGTEESLQVLKDVIADPEEGLEVRKWVLEALKTVDSKAATGLLIDLLTDPEEELGVRGKAAEELAGVGDEEAIQVLINLLSDSAVEPSLRSMVASALGSINGEKTIQVLIDRLTDPVEELAVRVAAAEALGEIGSEVATQPLANRLADTGEEARLRREAAEALAQIGGQEAARALERWLTDPEGDQLTMVKTEILSRALDDALKHPITDTGEPWEMPSKARWVFVSPESAESVPVILDGVLNDAVKTEYVLELPQSIVANGLRLALEENDQISRETYRRAIKHVGFYRDDPDLLDTLREISRGTSDQTVQKVAEEAATRYERKLRVLGKLS